MKAGQTGKAYWLRPLHFFHRQNYLNSMIYSNQPMVAYHLRFNHSSR